jgi:hypothetical protein
MHVQKGDHWDNDVIVEVEVVMGHVRMQKQLFILACTGLMELLRVLIRDQGVCSTMDKDSRARYLLNLLLIIEVA